MAFLEGSKKRKSGAHNLKLWAPDDEPQRLSEVTDLRCPRDPGGLIYPSNQMCRIRSDPPSPKFFQQRHFTLDFFDAIAYF